MATHKDPACGMQVKEAEAAGQAEHEGRRAIFVRPRVRRTV